MKDDTQCGVLTTILAVVVFGLLLWAALYSIFADECSEGGDHELGKRWVYNPNPGPYDDSLHWAFGTRTFRTCKKCHNHCDEEISRKWVNGHAPK